MGSSLNTELLIHGSITWTTERSLGAARGSLVSQMDGFYSVVNRKSWGKSRKFLGEISVVVVVVVFGSWAEAGRAGPKWELVSSRKNGF